MIIKYQTPNKEDLAAISAQAIVVKKKNPINFKNKITPKPWGSEYLLYENNDIAIWILTIKPQQKTSFHCHPNKTTSLINLSGIALCRVHSQKHKLALHDAIILGKKVFHQTHNFHIKENLYMMEIESPVDKFDLIRHSDSYGREGKPYEEKIKMIQNNCYFNNEDLIIGSSKVSIKFAANKNDFLKECKKINTEKVTILDRHIWNHDGEKLIEVGTSFDYVSLNNNFTINDNFHYITITKTESRI